MLMHGADICLGKSIVASMISPQLERQLDRLEVVVTCIGLGALRLGCAPSRAT